MPGTIDSNMGIIKSGITLPDPTYDWDMFYGVGREGRSRRDAHEGNQSFRGSIPEIYVLFEGSRNILEMCLGELSRDPVTLAGTNPGVITAVDETTMTDSGEDFTSVDSGVKDGNYAVFSGRSVGYIGTETGSGNTEVTVYPTPNRSGTKGWNGPQPAVGDEYEIRQTESVGTSAGNKYLVATEQLHTMTWAARHRNIWQHGASSVGSFITTNYKAGKVNRATLSAREGEKLMLALDEVMFRDVQHDVNLPSTSVPKYSGSTVAPTASLPTEQPMVFSEGTIALFELTNTFAKIKSFSLSIDNGLEEARYIATKGFGGVTTIEQVPHDLVEGNRTITLEVEAVMETREYWEHLVRQGLNDALSAKTGFDVRLEFRPDSAAAESFNIQGPATVSPVQTDTSSGSSVSSTTAQAASDNVGVVITEANHEVPGPDQPLVTVRLRMDIPTLVMWWDDD